MVKQVAGKRVALRLILAGFLVVNVAQQAVAKNKAEPLLSVGSIFESEMPDFGSITDVKAKKEAFFSYLKPIVDAENQKVAQDRKQLMAISGASQVSASDQEWLESMAKKYKLPLSKSFDKAWLTALSERVDTLPVSLALAQAANESAWGTSRFARQGNNLFGQWCFSKGCGLVPKQRNKGAEHEVRKFASVSGSVGAYLLNINTNAQYAELRHLRVKARRDGKSITGSYLSPGLQRYSQRGDAYVNELVAMISVNGLEKYDVSENSSSRHDAS